MMNAVGEGLLVQDRSWREGSLILGQGVLFCDIFLKPL